MDAWGRPHYEPGGGDAVLFFVIFGDIRPRLRLSESRYRSSGIPEGIGVWGYRQPADAAAIDSFRTGYLEQLAAGEQPDLLAAIRGAPGCVVVRGSVPDPPSLTYLRDIVGLVTGLLEADGVAVLDLLALRWWGPDEWRQRIFEPDAPAPMQHVTILISQEDDPRATWLHTRGMIKFGRPDISIHHVLAEHSKSAVELINRFIEFQAQGHIIAEGQEIRMADFPRGLRCYHAGSADDPDFNNVHVEIRRAL